MNLRKLLVVAVLILGGWLSIGAAQAQQYDFIYFSDGDGSYAQNSYEYQITINYNGTYSGTIDTFKIGPTGGALTEYKGYVYTQSVFFISKSMSDDPSLPPSPSDYELMFSYGPTGSNIGDFGGSVLLQSASWGNHNVIVGGPIDANITLLSDTFAGSMVSPAGAPEIDGSLAPKVGFLLGCLFLMFGRKKQNTEPFMTA